VSWLAVIIAALSSFVLGGLWYSPMLFGKAWMTENGFTEEKLKQGNMAKIFGGSFVLALVVATNLAFFLGVRPGVAWGTAAGAMAGVGWACASLGTLYLFERRSLRLFLIHAGYLAVSYAVMGAIIGIMQ
jgi:hypothetical protein